MQIINKKQKTVRYIFKLKNTNNCKFLPKELIRKIVKNLTGKEQNNGN